MELNLTATPVFEKNYQSKARVTVNQGGTGSSKTYSLAQLMIVLAHETTGERFSIVRKALPTLKATAMHDFFTILRESELYRQSDHNKSEHLYNLNGNVIEFFGLDQPQKVRSRRRDNLWLNEANEFSLEDWRQLSMRTDKRIFLDFNPSDQFHWIYDHVLTRDDVELIISTYRDNPFLRPEIVKEIEQYKHIDENYWRVYGLGERGFSQKTIYTHWQLCDAMPDNPDERIFGLDFAYNTPTALIEMALKDDVPYTDEWLYERYMNNSDLIRWMDDNDVPKDAPIYADAEDQNRINEIREAGYNIIAAEKGKDSVKAGIDLMKQRPWYITKRSINTQKEVKSYQWKEKDDIISDEPVKLNDHLMDAARYARFTHRKLHDQFIGFV